MNGPFPAEVKFRENTHGRFKYMFVHQLETWWEDVAYLSSRSPSAPTINIGGPLPITDIWPAQEGTQIKRAALMVHATLQNWQRLYRLVNKYTSTLNTA